MGHGTDGFKDRDTERYCQGQKHFDFQKSCPSEETVIIRLCSSVHVSVAGYGPPTGDIVLIKHTAMALILQYIELLYYIMLYYVLLFIHMYASCMYNIYIYHSDTP